jgi:hypothetical protein
MADDTEQFDERLLEARSSNVAASKYYSKASDLPPPKIFRKSQDRKPKPALSDGTEPNAPMSNVVPMETMDQPDSISDLDTERLLLDEWERVYLASMTNMLEQQSCQEIVGKHRD